jgi:hypothetical protein
MIRKLQIMRYGSYSFASAYLSLTRTKGGLISQPQSMQYPYLNSGPLEEKYDSRSRVFIETEDLWNQHSRRYSMSLGLRATLEGASDDEAKDVLEFPKGFATYDSARRDHAAAILNILKLASAADRVEENAIAEARSALANADAHGLHLLASASESISDVKAEPTDVTEAPPPTEKVSLQKKTHLTKKHRFAPYTPKLSNASAGDSKGAADQPITKSKADSKKPRHSRKHASAEIKTEGNDVARNLEPAFSPQKIPPSRSTTNKITDLLNDEPVDPHNSTSTILSPNRSLMHESVIDLTVNTTPVKDQLASFSEQRPGHSKSRSATYETGDDALATSASRPPAAFEPDAIQIARSEKRDGGDAENKFHDRKSFWSTVAHISQPSGSLAQTSSSSNEKPHQLPSRNTPASIHSTEMLIRPESYRNSDEHASRTDRPFPPPPRPALSIQSSAPPLPLPPPPPGPPMLLQRVRQPESIPQPLQSWSGSRNAPSNYGVRIDYQNHGHSSSWDETRRSSYEMASQPISRNYSNTITFSPTEASLGTSNADAHIWQPSRYNRKGPPRIEPLTPNRVLLPRTHNHSVHMPPPAYETGGYTDHSYVRTPTTPASETRPSSDYYDSARHRQYSQSYPPPPSAQYSSHPSTASYQQNLGPLPPPPPLPLHQAPPTLHSHYPRSQYGGQHILPATLDPRNTRPSHTSPTSYDSQPLPAFSQLHTVPYDQQAVQQPTPARSAGNGQRRRQRGRGGLASTEFRRYEGPKQR